MLSSCGSCSSGEIILTLMDKILWARVHVLYICQCTRASHYCALMYSSNYTHMLLRIPPKKPFKCVLESDAPTREWGVLICVERVILGYTALPTTLGVSPLPSQSQTRTQWCSSSLTGGIPRKCRVMMLLNQLSLSCLLHLLLIFFAPQVFILPALHKAPWSC